MDRSTKLGLQVGMGHLQNPSWLKAHPTDKLALPGPQLASTDCQFCCVNRVIDMTEFGNCTLGGVDAGHHAGTGCTNQFLYRGVL